VSDRIELRDLRVVAIVGALPHERVTPQPLSLDIDIERPFAAAAAEDDLTKTTNYADVITMAESLVLAGQFILLETLVHRVGAAILDYDPAITSVTVAVRKLEPPVSQAIATVGVRATLAR